MMEYQAIIKVGKATLKVLFTDGSITALGQNPAQFTTADFIVQRAIENSSDFKRGRIKLVNSIELDEDVRIESNAVKTGVQEAASDAAETAEAGAEKADTAEASEEAGAAAETGMTEVEFTCNADAKEYLENTFGVKSSLRTRADIIACGETYGVKIIFTE